MSQSRPKLGRRAAGWLGPTALLAIAPKCVLCALGYVGFGAAIGLSGPELCGAPASAPASWASPLSWLGVITGLGTVALHVLKQIRPERGIVSETRRACEGAARFRRAAESSQ
jgi:hypothetical protein